MKHTGRRASVRAAERQSGARAEASASGAEKARYVREVFTEIADAYDAMNNRMTWGMLRGWQRLVMRRTRLQAGDRALDVCCGTGEMTFQARELVGPAGEAVGLDFTPGMLDVAREKLRRLGYRNVTFVEGDALAMPFANASFQAVTSGFALRNVADIPGMIAEMVRVTAPGGRVVCIDVSVPRFFLFRWFFDIYYYKLVPVFGHKVDKNKKIGDRYPAYTWLAESLKTLPPQDAIRQMFADAGLLESAYKGVGFGAATVYWGTKPR